MMATTHAFLGLAAATAALPVLGRFAPGSAVLAAAFVGGLLPDLDLVTNHRKTFHFPFLLPLATLFFLVVYGVAGHEYLFLLAVLVGSAGFHAATDILGGGVGYEPWKNDSQHAVYNHLLGRWHRPRRLVRYAGAPEDLLLAAAAALPTVLSPTSPPVVDRALFAVLACSGVYVATRRRLPVVAEALRARLPTSSLAMVPDIQFEEE